MTTEELEPIRKRVELDRGFLSSDYSYYPVYPVLVQAIIYPALAQAIRDREALLDEVKRLTKALDEVQRTMLWNTSSAFA